MVKTTNVKTTNSVKTVKTTSGQNDFQCGIERNRMGPKLAHKNENWLRYGRSKFFQGSSTIQKGGSTCENSTSGM